MGSVIKFLVTILAPFVLIIIGAGIAALGLSQGWSWSFWTGLIIAGMGLIWGVVLLLLYVPVDLLP